MSVKALGVAMAALTMNVVAAGAAPVPPAVAAAQSGDDQYCLGFDNCWPIAHSYEVYSDSNMTTLIHAASDSCNVPAA
ncbi:hypothetical protein JIX58_02385 [Brevundimonas diminuta]|uniref:hypothetical protein n=1 Tax=Brevundimonas TaxID=41275 RepID=UPI0019076A0D|nr:MULTISPECIES: hypothetical protein [Brevundimonas]MBK1967940.1 hypothetical protein [Brevundimonas diminuta]MBK1974590.1 hypothetical protein [Brevundimonas diminuta]